MALTQISTDGIKNGTITGSDLATNVDLVDGQKLRFGNNQNLQIYYDGSSYIENSTAGHLFIKTLNGGSDIHLKSADDFFVTTGGENNYSIRAYSSAQVELYHNVVKTFFTTSAGIQVQGPSGGAGQITLSADANEDNADKFKLVVEDGGPLKIQNRASGSWETNIECNGNGNVELYNDNSKKCETYSSGFEIVAGQQLRLSHANASDGNDGTISSGVHGEGLTLVGCRTVSGGNREILHYGRIRPATNNAESIGSTNKQYGYIYGIRLFALYDSNSTGLYIGADSDIRGYHDGTNSYFTNKTGNFNIGNTTASSGNLILTGGGNDISLQAENGEEGVKVKPNSSVELYHDNSKKFETTSDGVQITGTDSELLFNATRGTGHQWQWSTSGNNATGIELRDTTAGHRAYIYHDNTGVGGSYHKWYTDGTERLQVLGANVNIPNDNARLRIGTGADLQLYHDGNDSFIDDAGTGSLILRTTNNSTVAIKNSGANMARFLAADAVELYHNNVLKFSTLSNGAEVSGHLHLGDNNELRLGNVGSGGDLKIYHDGTNSYLKNLTGWLNIPVSNNGVSIANSDFSESIARFLKDGACELYHNGSKKFETRGDGAIVTGRLKQTVGCAFRARASGGQSVANNTPTKVNFGTQVYDYGDVYNPSTSRFTAPVDGVYNFSWAVRMGTPSGTPKLDGEIRVNGNSGVNFVNCGYNQQASNNAAWIGSGDMFMSAGDYAELFIDQNTGATTTLSDNSNANGLSPGNHLWWAGHLVHEA